jgi:hypothetical protein
MEILTKRQRHLIYKKTYIKELNRIKENKEPFYFGLCHAINDNNNKININIDSPEFEANFPEFYKFKPKNLKNITWWNKKQEWRNNLSRFVCLLYCIEMTKPKKMNKIN